MTSLAAPTLDGAPYDAPAAWRRAAAFFVVALAIGAASGAWRTATRLDAAHLHVARWWVVVLAAGLVEVVAYWVVWPRGTFHLDRRLDLPAALAVGVPWGVGQGLVFLALWRLAGAVTPGKASAAAVAFVLISTYQGCFHALWWDRLVAPPHNIPAWNLPKVLCCHVPNLAVTLALLTAYGDGAVAVALQVVALVGAAVFMRFPRPSYRPAG